MDEFDMASELEERQREAALARSRIGKILHPKGECHWCAAPVDRLFCIGVDCRDDWERADRARERNGRQIDDGDS